jgi:RNA polymerase sigma factor (sigma-70 family)
LIETHEWESHRPAVFGVAYRLLGSVADAEDVVQDVWLRSAAADLDEVEDLRAWLVTVAARRSYDILKSARVRRESYVGPWLPEPLATGPDAAEPVLVDDSITTAMLVVMEELTPPERVAFVLHDVFDVTFDEIARVLERSAAACRQLASRARRQVAGVTERPRVPAAERSRVLAAFRVACQAGDLTALVSLLDPDAVYCTDGGGRISAARKLIVGAERVAMVLVRVLSLAGPSRSVPCEVNGEPGFLRFREGRLTGVDTFEIAGGRITAIRRVVNPEKLSRFPVTLPEAASSP